MKKFFSFRGTTSQEDYWKVVIFLVIASFVVMLVERPFYYNRMTTGNNLLDASLTLLWIPVVWVWVALSRRRLRDISRSFLWLFCLPVPFLNLLAIVVFGSIPSKKA